MPLHHTVEHFRVLRHWQAFRSRPHRQSGQVGVASPAANRLEALKGDRDGQHSIRINDQWRICFVWREGHAHEVEIVDYH